MLRKTLYLLSLYSSTLQLLGSQAHQYPFQLTKVEATVHHQIISTTDKEKEPLPFLDQILAHGTTILERKCLSELIKIYASQLTPLHVSPSRLSTVVEDQFRTWHQQGMTEEALKAHWGKDSMKDVRKAVQERYKTILLSYDLVNTILAPDTATPAQLTQFYQAYLLPQFLSVPPKIVLVQLVAYPIDHTETLDSIKEKFDNLYNTLVTLSSKKQKTKTLLRTIKRYYTTQSFTVRYGYISNMHGLPSLTLEEIPRDVQQVMQTAGMTELIPGQLIPPHICTTANGQKGVRLIFVQQILPAHPVNLVDDYAYIELLFLQTQRNTRLIQWWNEHKEEIQRYGHMHA